MAAARNALCVDLVKSMTSRAGKIVFGRKKFRLLDERWLDKVDHDPRLSRSKQPGSRGQNEAAALIAGNLNFGSGKSTTMR